MNNLLYIIILLVVTGFISCKGKKDKMKEKPPATVDVMIAETAVLGCVIVTVEVCVQPAPSVTETE